MFYVCCMPRLLLLWTTLYSPFSSLYPPNCSSFVSRFNSPPKNLLSPLSTCPRFLGNSAGFWEGSGACTQPAPRLPVLDAFSRAPHVAKGRYGRLHRDMGVESCLPLSRLRSSIWRGVGGLHPGMGVRWGGIFVFFSIRGTNTQYRIPNP